VFFFRNQFKASLCLLEEDPDALLELFGKHALNYRQVQTTKDLEKAVDSVTLKDVTDLASKILRGKGALVSVGNLERGLYLEDLI